MFCVVVVAIVVVVVTAAVVIDVVVGQLERTVQRQCFLGFQILRLTLF